MADSNDKNDRSVRHLELFITERCNLRCEYCFTRDRTGKDIDLDLAFDSVRWAIENNQSKNFHISYWGGEPFMRPDIIENIALFTKEICKNTKKKTSFGVPTNSTLLSDKNLDLSDRISLGMSLSLDGDLESQRHRPTATGHNSFGTVIKVMNRLRKRTQGRRRPSVRLTASESNIDRFVDNMSFFHDRGFWNVAFYPDLDHPWKESSWETFKKEQETLALRYVQSAKSRGPMPRYNLWTTLLQKMYNFHFHDKRRDHGGVLRFCGAGRGMLAVTVEGDIYPCHRFVFYDRPQAKTKLGNVRTGWNKEQRDAYFGLQQEDAKVQGSGLKCNDCSLFDYCDHQCIAINYLRTGEFTTIPIEACRFNKVVVDVVQNIFDEVKDDERALDRILGEKRKRPDPNKRRCFVVEELLDQSEELAEAALNRLLEAEIS